MKAYDVVIIGAGPSGIFTALELCNLDAGLKILMVDSGRSIKKRACPARDIKRCTLCNPCGIMRGWGGAGAFSDGKLSLSEEVGGNIVDYIGRDKSKGYIRYADEMYVRFGSPDTVHGKDDRKVEEIMYEASKHNIRLVPCPVRHMGTENALDVLSAMYEHLVKQPGFEFRELTEAVSINAENGKVKSLTIRRTKQTSGLNGPNGAKDDDKADNKAYGGTDGGTDNKADGGTDGKTDDKAVRGTDGGTDNKADGGTGGKANGANGGTDLARDTGGLGDVEQIGASYIVVAPGRAGAHWLKGVAEDLDMQVTNNEVDIGVRVEVPNSVMDHLTDHLYEAKLVYYSDTFENKVRTFCMNPGGHVSEEHYEGGLAVVNGHSYGDKEMRTANTNFALLVSTRFTKPFNQPIEYGKYIASIGNMLTGGGIMVQRLGDLLKGRRTDESRLKKGTTVPTLESAVPGDLSFVLPHRHLTSIIESLAAFDKLAPGLYSQNTLLYGVEVKFYSSKVKVDEQFRTNVDGLYAIGDGAGITRGLMQASVTGVRVARDIIDRNQS